MQPQKLLLGKMIVEGHSAGRNFCRNLISASPSWLWRPIKRSKQTIEGAIIRRRIAACDRVSLVADTEQASKDNALSNCRTATPRSGRLQGEKLFQTRNNGKIAAQVTALIEVRLQFAKLPTLSSRASDLNRAF